MEPMKERALKVLIFAMAFPPEAVGSGTYAHRLARGFAEKGCQVLVLALQDQQGRCADFDREQPYRTLRIPRMGSVLQRYLEARTWLRRMLAEFRPDSLWTTNGMATRVAGLVRELDGVGVPVVSCMRGSDIVNRLPGKGPGARLESLFQRRCYRHSAAIAAASQYLKGIAVGKGVDGEKIFINPSAFDFGQLDGYQYDPARLLARFPALAGRKIVLTVARLVEQKRVHLLVRAVARLVERVPELCFAVVGDGPDQERLGELVEELGIGGQVLLVGQVAPMSVELCDFYSGAHVFAMAGVREGLPNVFMEAGALGLPSVGVADGGTPEIVRDGETGLLAAPDDVEEIADRMGQLLLDGKRAKEMGGRARRWIEEMFSAEVMVERSYRVLQGVVSGTFPERSGGGDGFRG